MSQNWLRSCTLAATGSTGKGASVNGGGQTDLRIRFNIESHTLQSPDQGCFIITNPGRETIAAFQQEFAELTLTAGYEGSTGQIFKGLIIQSMYGEMENLTDRLLRIYAASNDLAYNQTRVSTTLAAGCSPQDIVNACVQAMAPYGVAMGQVVGVDLSQPKFPRGYPLSGMARDFLREVVLSKGATYTIANDKVDIIGKNASVPSDTIEVNASTGMVGQAIQTIEGVRVRMLINAAVKVNSNIRLNPKSVVSPVFSGSAPPNTSAPDLLKEFSNQLDPSGVYRVLHIEYDADTRGAQWFQNLTCVGNSSGPNLNNTQIGLGYS